MSFVLKSLPEHALEDTICEALILEEEWVNQQTSWWSKASDLGLEWIVDVVGDQKTTRLTQERRKERKKIAHRESLPKNVHFKNS